MGLCICARLNTGESNNFYFGICIHWAFKQVLWVFNWIPLHCIASPANQTPYSSNFPSGNVMNGEWVNRCVTCFMSWLENSIDCNTINSDSNRSRDAWSAIILSISVWEMSEVVSGGGSFYLIENRRTATGRHTWLRRYLYDIPIVRIWYSTWYAALLFHFLKFSISVRIA